MFYAFTNFQQLLYPEQGHGGCRLAPTRIVAPTRSNTGLKASQFTPGGTPGHLQGIVHAHVDNDLSNLAESDLIKA